MQWVTYCLTCKKELIEKIANGSMAESYGKMHAKKEKHKVIIGYEVKEE
jgi:hypothetical protein